MSPHESAVVATAAGVMPGEDLFTSARHLEQELTGHLPVLPELPARGHHATLQGRAVAMLAELHAELTSYGWRLTSGAGADHRRTRQLLRADVDTLADVRGARAESGDDHTPAELVVHLLGPVSLAAQLALPSGEKILTDHGARRDVADSLAAGAGLHLEHVRRSCAPTSLRVILLEPDFTRACAGAIPTVSGYRSIRALPRDDARALLGGFAQALRTAGADEVILDLEEAPQLEHVEDFRAGSSPSVDGFGLPLAGLGARDWERTAELVEQGTRFAAALLSEAPDPRSGAPLPQVSSLASRVSTPWRALGMPMASLHSMTLTPVRASVRERLAGLGEADVLRLISRTRDAADALTEQMHA